MTDSESEISNPNVFTFQNVNTTVSARGPNTNISNFSFRNQPTSTRNFEQQRYAKSVSNQKSIYYRREMSPMSIRSAYDIRPQYNGMGSQVSQQSVFKGRSGSPMSMRSINSSASVSAADIAFAFKNVKFNKYDLKVIQEAYHKLMKQRNRKRIEKRRNMRVFLKGSRSRPGGDSGEQGSDSSISSDDCRSVKTSYKENISSSRLARIDPVDFRNTVRDSNMVKDCTKSFKQNTFKNMFAIGTSNNRNQTLNSSSYPNQTVPSLKERFKTGFELPSQRFNNSVASTVIPDNAGRQPIIKQNTHKSSERYTNDRNVESESEDDIFPETIVQSKTVCNTETLHKRTLESEDDSYLPDRKKLKNSSPNKMTKSKTQQLKEKNSSAINNNVEHSNNFEFTKPTLPMRKSRPIVKEKVIAKSKQPHIELKDSSSNSNLNNVETVEPIISPGKSDITETQTEQCELSQNSDVSMRPSFIKRKLFTQKLDLVEKGNLSSDASNSPQNVYSAFQKEKNKTRKLVISQSCMNREVQDDSNLLELIHKIVPPDSINKTNQTSMNLTKMDVNHSNKKDDVDTWDVSSVISMCNEHNVSDTFTDEEIFESDDKKGDKAKTANSVNHSPISRTNTKTSTKPKATETVAENNTGVTECRIVIDKMPKNLAPLKSVTHKDLSVNTVKNSAKTFWDTDFESDNEYQVTAQRKLLKEAQTTANTVTEVSKPEFKHPFAVSRSPTSRSEIQIPETSRWLNSTKNTTDINNTIDNSRRCNISSLSVRSHRTSKKKKCCNETGYQDMFFKNASKAKNESKTASEPVSNGKNFVGANGKTTSILPESKCKTSSELQESKCKSKSPESNIKITLDTQKHNKTSSKPETKASNPELRNKNLFTKKHTTSIDNMASNSVDTEITKNITSKKGNKPTTNTQNSNKSMSHTRKSPREKKSKADREKNGNINVLNETITNRPIRTCRTPSLNRLKENSRSSKQFNISPLSTILQRMPKKNKITSLQEITPLSDNNIIKPKASHGSHKPSKKPVVKVKTKTENNKIVKSNTKNINISITSVPTRKSPRVKKPKQINEMTNYQTPKTPKIDRPIRLCRSLSQNRSMESYRRR